MYVLFIMSIIRSMSTWYMYVCKLMFVYLPVYMILSIYFVLYLQFWSLIIWLASAVYPAVFLLKNLQKSNAWKGTERLYYSINQWTKQLVHYSIGHRNSFLNSKAFQFKRGNVNKFVMSQKLTTQKEVTRLTICRERAIKANKIKRANKK